RVSFKNTNLEQAIFRKSEMIRVDFSKANLKGVDFSKSEAGRTRFDDAILGDNDFSFANVARADFRKARITGPIAFSGAYFYRTRLEGVDLTNTTGLVQWQIEMACGDDATKLPEGVIKPQSWPCSSE
ncbi:MAG: pentapeptide repeat-containing protein, partial [Rhizobiaceae bacterium]|nr:pentapeptide repeat-containing protein [Rhizobiaceae bacterium]